MKQSCFRPPNQAKSAGVILIRFPGNARRELADLVTKLIKERGGELVGAFVVIQPGHIRINPHSSAFGLPPQR